MSAEFDSASLSLWILPEQETQLLVLHWWTSAHHAYGNGGWGSIEEHLQVVDLQSETLVLSEVPNHNSSSSESPVGQEEILETHACHYQTDYTIEGDLLLVTKVVQRANYHRTERLNSEAVEETTDKDCRPPF